MGAILSIGSRSVLDQLVEGSAVAGGLFEVERDFVVGADGGVLADKGQDLPGEHLVA